VSLTSMGEPLPCDSFGKTLQRPVAAAAAAVQATVGSDRVKVVLNANVHAKTYSQRLPPSPNSRYCRCSCCCYTSYH
jgi:hypothetical protein